MLRFLSLLAFLFLNYSGHCSPAFVMSTNCNQALSAVQKLNFAAADQYLKEEKRLNPDNLLIHYIESQRDFYRSFLSEGEAELSILRKNNEKRIDLLERASIKSPYLRFCIAEMHLSESISALKFEEFMSSAGGIRKAYKLLRKNQEEYPDFLPNLRGLGFIHSVAGSIPSSYQWLIGLMGIDGGMKEGKAELNRLCELSLRQPAYQWLYDESVVLTTFLEMSQGKNKDTEKIRSRLSKVKDISDKQMLVFCKSVFHFSEAENDSALTLLSSRRIPEGTYRIDYLDYMEGIARVNKLDWTAERYFLRYIQNFPGKSFELAAWQRIAWIHLLKGDMEGYRKYIARCTDPEKGKDLTDDDRLAMREASSGRVPHIALLRCRLLFDGGYYQLAMKEWSALKASELKSKADQLEYGYRLARICDKTGQTKTAITHYELTVRNGSDEPYYYAANSALLLGQLYEDQANYKLAATWFKKAQEFEDTEYQFSIEQKARAGLSRVESKIK